MVEHNDGLDTYVDGFFGVLQGELNTRIVAIIDATVYHTSGEYTLQYDRTVSVIPYELELVPAPKDARGNLANPLASQ